MLSVSPQEWVKRVLRVYSTLGQRVHRFYQSLRDIIQKRVNYETVKKLTHSPYDLISVENPKSGTSLAVQWLRL